jgi:tripartite-type tricarboxylate transporter receptor subunit TctC
VPYKGGAPAAMAIRSGEVDFTIIDEANAAPLLKDGKVRAIAQTGLRPLESFPQLIRIADVAPGFDASFWMGLSARKGSPTPQLERLHDVVLETLQKDMQDLVRRSGLWQGGGSRADFGAFMARERDKWTQVIKDNQITTS